jgi:hypothetical protein
VQVERGRGRRTRTASRFGFLAAVVLTVSGLVVGQPGAPSVARGAPPVGDTRSSGDTRSVGDTRSSGDGRSVTSAGASCWGIKRAHPASRSGRYWVQPPTMVAPMRVYCNMTMDGGGWVLIARGRNGWTFDEAGQQSPTAVASTIKGRAAYAPAALSSATIDQLLGRRPVSSLTDGVVISRADSNTGASARNITWVFGDLGSWSWAFDGGHRLASTVVEGVRRTGSNTRDSQITVPGEVGTGHRTADDHGRWTTNGLLVNDGEKGFAFGTRVRGSSSDTSRVWSPTNGTNPLPFTRVWIRPRLANTTRPVIPDAGLPAVSQRAGMSPITDELRAGVVGLLEEGDTEPEIDSLVQAIAQVGDTVYIGGKFAAVEQGRRGTVTPQPYLAAFDRSTGAWIDTFRPVLDGPVWDMVVTPDGRLVIGGQFSRVGGVPSAGVARIDPVSGALDPGWQISVRLTCGGGVDCPSRPLVRTLDVHDGWLYLGGNFSRLVDRTGDAPAGRIAKVALVDGSHERRFFHPSIDLPVFDIDATTSRVYIAGMFTTVNGQPVSSVAVLRPNDGSLVPGMGASIPTALLPDRRYQQTILEVGDSVWHGGSEHNIHVHRRADHEFVRGWVTARRGGDAQAMASDGTTVFVGSHVDSHIFSDTVSWPGLTGFTRVSQARWVSAFDARTREHLRDFVIEANSQYGEGAWELFVDSVGCLWIGGDFIGGSVIDGRRNYASGFMRTCPVDSVAPATPTGLRVTGSAGARTLGWNPARDDRGGIVTYEVLRHDRVVARTFSTSWTDTTNPSSSTARYVVRTVDAAGNRSATTAVVRP